MNQQVELSIIVPVYNGADFIQATIDSVLQYSKGFPCECIVIDDGSTDHTAQLLARYSGLIRVIHQVNGGEGNAVNRGIREALGKYILVVSADDPVLTDRLFAGVTDFFENNPEVVAWYPDWQIIDEFGFTLRTIKLPPYDFVDLFARNRVLPGPGTWFRKYEALSIGGRNTRWKYVGDYDFWLRLSQIGTLAHRNEVLAQWRHHARSTSIAQRGPSMAQERLNVIDDFIKDNLNNLDYKSITLARAHANYQAAKLGYFSRNVHSRQLFLSAFRNNRKVLFSSKIHEVVFMLAFPASKWIVDTLKRTFDR